MAVATNPGPLVKPSAGKVIDYTLYSHVERIGGAGGFLLVGDRPFAESATDILRGLQDIAAASATQPRGES